MLVLTIHRHLHGPHRRFRLPGYPVRRLQRPDESSSPVCRIREGHCAQLAEKAAVATLMFVVEL